AEPGATVTVTDANGQVIGEATAGENGEFSVELDEPLTNGEDLKVTATDAAGNKSDVTTVNAPDTTAPDAPINIAVSQNGLEVTGQAEPGSKITITDEDGNEIGNTQTDINGNFKVTLVTPLANGDDIEVIATDATGNKSDSTNNIVDLDDSDTDIDSDYEIESNSNRYCNIITHLDLACDSTCT